MNGPRRAFEISTQDQLPFIKLRYSYHIHQIISVQLILKSNQYKFIIKMRRVETDFLRNNHHSLNRKQSPITFHNSEKDSVVKTRKLSTASIKENIPDLEKLIMDIKISPVSQSNQQTIKQICKSLKQLQKNPIVSDEVSAVFLLMQTIQNKLASTNKQQLKISQKLANRKEESFRLSEKKDLSDISPIKQMQNTRSRILYTNFSLKQIQKSISQENSIMHSNEKTVNKIAVSKFEQSGNQQVQKLNDEIKYLEKLLASKTKGVLPSTELTIFKKKSFRS